MSRRDEHYWRQRAASLDWLVDVPDVVLIDMVLRDCQCAWIFDPGEPPELSGEDDPDRELAARLCAQCPAMDACLELDLRIYGPRTTGVFGALPEQDRRALYPYWAARRAGGQHREGGDPQ